MWILSRKAIPEPFKPHCSFHFSRFMFVIDKECDLSWLQQKEVFENDRIKRGMKESQ
jgi:hypothetical protein